MAVQLGCGKHFVHPAGVPWGQEHGEQFYFSCLSMIVVAGSLDKEWKRKDCSSPLVSEVLLLPPTSASMEEAER